MEQLRGDKDEEETAQEKIYRLGKEMQDLQVQERILLNRLPPITKPPVPEPLLKLRHALREKDTERELLLEDERASKAVEEYLQENPSILDKVDECPICLDPIFDVAGAAMFLCCGSKTCRSCMEPFSAAGNDTCPLCREKFPSNESEVLSILRTKAAEGKAWAQCRLGIKYYCGSLGLAVDKQKAESLYRSAADQGYSDGQYQLGIIEGEKDNESGACRLFEAAASQGHMNALGFLGRIHHIVGRGAEEDDVTAVRFLTVSSKLTTDRFAHRLLADCFAYGQEGLLEQSLIRAVYYMKLALEESESSPCDMVFYAKLLWHLSGSYYPDYEISPSGDNHVPEALFWYRRAHAKSMDAETVELFGSYESKVKEMCACCYKPLSTDKSKCCVECKAVYYCSRECQATDWKAGHKKDCVKSLKKRLRATGNFNGI